MRNKHLRLVIRKQRVRKKIFGTADKPRLSVYRSLNHIYAHIIDDITGRTVVSASSLTHELKESLSRGGNISAAQKVGELLAKKCSEMGIQRVVFDRNGYVYHGRVKALAEAARNAGLKI